MLVGYLLAVCFCSCSRSPKSAAKNGNAGNWNAKAAAAYLDQREVAWASWPGAARDHGTYCISCHTVLPYALSRAALREVLSESGQSPSEQQLLRNVSTRVRLWGETEPYYTDSHYHNGKSVESRGTESVLNALVLATNDAQTGRFSDLTRLAFQNMWALQLRDGDNAGAWSWLEFGMEPWEAPDSPYYGAVLAARAVGTAPENYRDAAEIQPQMQSLRGYLNRHFDEQSTINHVALLWATTKMPNLIDADHKASIIREVIAQQKEDGSWALSSLSRPRGWNLYSSLRAHFRSDFSRQNTDGDGYATALITLVLRQAGTPESAPSLQRGIAWLESHQNQEDGSWPSWSLTKKRDPSSNSGHFMRDAATAYAVLALTESGVAPASAVSSTQADGRIAEPNLTAATNSEK